ncbi:MAG: nuclear transport factor 2 family protein [Actinobacteria bacterium]|nr:nuclear transport factor 2 family protein [Actinomycetota bacterium]
MSRQNVEALRRMYEAFQRGDWEQMVRDTDPEIEIREPRDLVTESGVYHGHAGFVEAVKWWPSQWDDFRAEITQMIDADDDQVVWVARHRGRGHGSGIEVENEIAYLSTFRAGKMIRWEMFLTLPEALEAVGLRE